jgi:hypothetical protein
MSRLLFKYFTGRSALDAEQPMIGPAVVAILSPGNQNNSISNTGYVSLATFPEVYFLLQLGGVDITVDFKIREAQDGSGTGEQDLTGFAITQLTGTDDNKQAVIHVKATDLTGGRTFVRARLTIGAGTTNMAGIVGLGFTSTYTKASSGDLASVAQVVGG